MADYNENSPTIIPAPKKMPRVSKAEAGYVEDPNGIRCGNCNMYIDIGEETGLCTKVKGRVNPNSGVSYFWAKRRTSATKDMIDPKMQVSKEVAGYEEVPPRGSHCGICGAYEHPRRCKMVGLEGEEDIDPEIGCCNYWHPNEEMVVESKYNKLFKFFGRVDL